MFLFDILETTCDFKLDEKFKILAKNETICGYCHDRPGIYKQAAIIGGNFPRKDLVTAGDNICERCATIFKAEQLRRSSWFLFYDGSQWVIDFFDITQREKLIKYLFQKDYFPCYLAITFRKVKHNLFAEFSLSRYSKQVVIDGSVTRYDAEEWQKVWRCIFELYNNYHQTKEQILGLNLYPKSQSEYDLLLEYKKRLKNYKNRSFYKVLVNKLLYKPGEKKEDEEQTD